MATIRKRNGRWQVQVRRKTGFKRSATFHSRKDAERWAMATEQEADRISSGLVSASREDAALTELIARYRKSILPLKRCQKQESSILHQLSQAEFAGRPVSLLKPETIASFRDERLQVVSASTVIRCLGVLGHVIETARREWGYDWLANPVRAIRKPKPNPGRTRRLTASEELKLFKALNASRNDHIALVARFALETAMRQSEIMGLRWNNMSFHQKLVYLPMTKNGKPRHVPLTVTAMKIMAIQCELGCERPFPTTASAVQQAWRRATRREKIADLHFHDLRHEAITRLFERGLALPEVAMISGHTDPRQLMRYTHMRAMAVAEKLHACVAAGANIQPVLASHLQLQKRYEAK